MRLSKYLHSCLLIEDNQKTVLIDPGSFTYQEHALTTDMLSKLDYMLITHEHADHMSILFIKQLVAKFPDVQLLSNPSVAQILAKEHIAVHTDLSTLPSDVDIRFEDVSHGRIFDRETPQHVLFEVFGRLTHPGDSIDFERSLDILALPLIGPSWMITQAAEKAVALKPKTVIPIHDHHWRDNFRKEYYQRLEAFFKEKGIEFKPLESGATFEV